MRPLPETFRRYIAIGDSSTEGLGDPILDGSGGGWSRRLADHLALHGDLAYMNLGSSGRTTREIKDEQLAPALAFAPDLVTWFSGTNDVIRPRFKLEEVLADMREIQHACVASGATTLTFTLPDLTPLLPIAKLLAPRIQAMNAGVRRLCAESGTLLVDFAAHTPIATDPRLWCEDRIHANTAGHERIADALAEALRLPGSSNTWREPLPAAPALTRWERVRLETTWARRHLLPWIWQGISGGGDSHPTAERLEAPPLTNYSSTTNRPR